MKKYIVCILALVGIAFMTSACSGDTYAKRLDKEKKAIKRFIADNDIVVLDKYPGDDYEFGEKEYFKDKSGVYIHIIKRGTDRKARKYVAEYQSGTTVTMEIGTAYSLMAKNKEERWGNKGNGDLGMTLIYGVQSTYLGEANSSGVDYTCKSPACAIPLEYVGENGVASIIVPFLQGSQFQEASYEPIFIQDIRYYAFTEN